VAVVDVTVAVAVFVVAEVVVEVEVCVEIFNQEVQKAIRDEYALSLVTQGATAAALQVPKRALFAGAADIIGTRSTVARKPAKATMMDGVGRGKSFRP
jgi:predicted house-cleaning NTP pyrophosphatase (Maf/HAM1 superfamily)